MPNPFVQTPTNNLQNIYKILMSSNNPQQVFKNLVNQNPRFSPILDMLNSGNDPQQIFYYLCKQQGVNPQTFLNQITGNNT